MCASMPPGEVGIWALPPHDLGCVMSWGSFASLQGLMCMLRDKGCGLQDSLEANAVR